MSTHHLEIFADYSQFYLCDPEYLEDWSQAGTEEAMASRLVALTTTVVFGTDRNFTVPVDFSLHPAKPDIQTLAASADHAVMASVECRSGRMRLAGCTEYLPGSFAVDAPSGHYGVLYTASQLGSVNGLDGNDRYAVHLWPTSEPAPLTVIRCHPLP